MSLDPKRARALFSARVDDELDGNAARDLDRTLEQNPDLAEAYEDFAEVIQLLNALPRPEPDPDFSIKVQRRILRRQRGRRRGRRQREALPTLGTLSTLVALVVVAAMAVLFHPSGQTVAALENAPGGNAAAVPSQLMIALDVDAATAVPLLQRAQAEGALGPWTLVDPELASARVTPAQLALLLEQLSRQVSLRMQPGDDAPESGFRIQLKLAP